MMNLLKFFRRRKAKRADFNLVPVIFANGEDDDLPGFTAALRNEPVLFGETIYQPGEDITINGKRLAFSCNNIIIADDKGKLVTAMNPSLTRGVVVTLANPGREIEVSDCHSHFNVGQKA